MKKFTWKIILPFTIICLITGLLSTVVIQNQLRLGNLNAQDKNSSLINIIENLETNISFYEKKIDTLRLSIQQFEEKNSKEENQVHDLNEEIIYLKLLTGQTTVKGSGIILTLDDNLAGAELAKNSNLIYSPEEYIIHDRNLIYLLNSIKNFAEAISINDQRIIYRSDIRCVGTVIMVNSSRLAPPYEIRVIGDPNLLQASVLNSEEYLLLKEKDFPLNIVESDEIEIPAYKGTNNFMYAKLYEGDE